MRLLRLFRRWRALCWAAQRPTAAPRRLLSISNVGARGQIPGTTTRVETGPVSRKSISLGMIVAAIAMAGVAGQASAGPSRAHDAAVFDVTRMSTGRPG